MGSYLAHGPEIYPKAHENPRAFSCISGPIFLESSIQCPCRVGLHHLPNIKYEKEITCEACVKGKQTKSIFHFINVVSSQIVLELLDVDLLGPTKTLSLGGKRYGFMIVDDFSKFTWVLFLSHKDESFEAFRKFCKKIQNEKDFKKFSIRNDHGGEIKNTFFKNFFYENGISHNFSC